MSIYIGVWKMWKTGGHVERFVSRVRLAMMTQMFREAATNSGIRRFLSVLILMYGVLDCTISFDLIKSHLIILTNSSSLVSLPEFGCCARPEGDHSML
jgi:hypothetical protein